MEEEGYRTLTAFLSMDDLGQTEEVFYRASALPSDIGEEGRGPVCAQGQDRRHR